MKIITDTDAKMITVHEAMRLLSLGRTTVYRLMKEKTLKNVKIGSARRIKYESVKKLCQTGDS